MDTSDSQIVFDENGICEYCHNFDSTILPSWHTDHRGEARLRKLSHEIRKDRGLKTLIVLSG